MRVLVSSIVLAAALAAPAVAGARLVPGPRDRPAPVAMSWNAAGAFVWHTEHVDPSILGARMRRAGFGWVALLVADGKREQRIDPRWIERFRAASGLRVGAWSVLRKAPLHDARRAARLVDAHGLDFYIANAEREYAYTVESRWSPDRFARSQRFVAAFRRAKPKLPAALSSYCRPDQHDLDWTAWRDGGFAFLPQAYVNDFGANATPAMCVAAARSFFPERSVHPTVGAWVGQRGKVWPRRYAALLEQARTNGFSIYLADNGMNGEAWRRYGELLAERRLARAVG